NRYPCGFLWYSGAVRSNGDFVMCYPSQWFDRTQSVGNVHTDNLHSYWKKLDQVRRLHLAGRWNDIPACRDCDLWKTVPSVYSRRSDGTFSIPRHRWLIGLSINYVKSIGFLKNRTRVHRS